MVFRDAKAAHEHLFKVNRIVGEMEKHWHKPENRGKYLVGYEDEKGVKVEIFNEHDSAKNRVTEIPEEQRPYREIPFYVP